MTEPFTEFDHRISIVPRWSIIHTIQAQNLATHCFNVERIAVKIARGWFEIDDQKMLFQISQWALHHDDEEVLTGDITSIVKDFFATDELKEHAGWAFFQFPWDDFSQVKLVVKLADKLEWYYFLSVERALGNGYITDLLFHIRGEIGDYVRKKCSLEIQYKAVDWMHRLDLNPPKVTTFNRITRNDQNGTTERPESGVGSGDK